ncbi:putative malonyl-CoA-acyl carrier protein transacylase, mitochondrial [Amphibalanus amphitrite]|uniref:[acyl-carrier-protein] S-malonyltransferase n=1 Tax=Amphibalanus amphitrite TaxID=1232801 RepID=A0A6A4X2C6_AMPAM|nr:putative malonyl-CoA-acyl carrier protein transacylase, mitochondrial [Amphibalanus amphitrite]
MSSRMGTGRPALRKAALPRLATAAGTHHRPLKMVFRLTDRNKDGSITAEELKRMLLDKLDIQVDDSLIGELMTSAGENDGGLISEGQFISWFLKMQSLSADKAPDHVTSDLFSAFRLFDRDGNGYITLDELRRAMDLIEERMTEAELNALIQMADADKDGRINYEGTNLHRTDAVYRLYTGPDGLRARIRARSGSAWPTACCPSRTWPTCSPRRADILGYDLLELCRRGPAQRLDRTEHAQPALLVTSLAAVERLRDERPRAVDSCMAAAGFSVGELAALTFSGALSFSAAVRLAHVRGRAMQLASELAPSGMMTVLCRPDARLGFACSLARRWCEERGLEAPQCAVASFLFPQCKVVAGHVEALDFIAERAAEFGLRRCTRLRVSGAFHTPLMAPAAEPLRAALADTRISAPRVPVYSNVDGRQYRSAEHVRRRLVEQLTKPVKWEQTMHVLYERSPGVPFPDTYECGPGDTLTAILKKVNAKAADSCTSVEV